MSFWTRDKILQRGGSSNWDRNNKFYIRAKNLGSEASSALGSVLEVESLNYHLKDINTMDISTDPIESFINEKFVITQGRPNTNRLNLKFMDSDQGLFYKSFSKAFYKFNKGYPDEIKIDFEIYIEPCYSNQSSKLLFTCENCILTGITGLTFDNGSQNQITEFTVTFSFSKIVSA